MVQDGDIVTIEGTCIRSIEWCYSSDPYYPKTTQFSICCVAFSIFVTGGDMGRIGLLHIQTIEPSDHTQSQRVTRTSAISASCLIYSCAELEHSSFLWPPYVIRQAVIFSSCGFYSARNAGIASTVLATAIPSVRPSVRPSVCPSVRHTPVLCQNDGT